MLGVDVTEGEAWALVEERAREVPGWVAFLPPGVTIVPEEPPPAPPQPIVDTTKPLVTRLVREEPAPPPAPTEMAPLVFEPPPAPKEKPSRLWLWLAGGAVASLFFLILIGRDREEER
jgi:hypothetical protein